MAALFLLHVRLARAGDLAETNQMPASVHGLMDDSGHVRMQAEVGLAPADPNSLRVLPPLKKNRYVLIKPTKPKSHWSFWNNIGIKYVGHNHDPLNVVTPPQRTPYSALAQFEYDFIYSFNF
jgi:hypothetical protein